jgi:two-component system response regulator EvgA
VSAALAARNGSAPAVVLVSSRDACDYGSLIAASGARGFIAKAELSGYAVSSLLP